jgi:hypothetical protein
MKTCLLLWLICAGLLLPSPRLQGQKAESNEAEEAAALRKIDGIQISEEPEGTVDSVYLNNAKLSGATLARLNRFKSLRVVVIHGQTGAEFNDSSLAFLQGLKKVEILDCRATKIGDVGLKYIRELTGLRKLVLGASRVTDKGLASLKKQTRLQELSLNCPKVTDAGLAHFRGLKKLKRLGLFWTAVRGPGLAHLKDMADLQMLDLTGSAVTDKGLKHLPPAKKLRWVDVTQTKASAMLRHVSKGKVRLRVNGSRARLLDLETAKPFGKTISHSSYRIPGEMRITCWAFSPDGKRVVTGAGLHQRSGSEENNTGQLSVWDAATGKLFARFNQDAESIGSVRKVAFLKDNMTILFRADNFEEDGR